MYAALAGKTLTHTAWKQAGVQAKLAARTATMAMKSLIENGQVQKIGKLYSIVPQEEEDRDPPDEA